MNALANLIVVVLLQPQKHCINQRVVAKWSKCPVNSMNIIFMALVKLDYGSHWILMLGR